LECALAAVEKSIFRKMRRFISNFKTINLRENLRNACFYVSEFSPSLIALQ